MTSQEDVIDWQALNRRDDEASAEGTRAVKEILYYSYSLKETLNTCAG